MTSNDKETTMNQLRSERRTLLMAAMAAALPAALPLARAAAPWPSKPVRLVVTSSPGSGGDVFARLLAPGLQAALGQPFYVENKVGANGIIANDFVAKSSDAHTVLFAPSSAIVINPFIQPKLPYDTQRDLLPVGQIGLSGIFLVANPETGIATLADLVRYAKANPGKLSCGSWGNGSSGHLALEGLKAHYGIDIHHVPYKALSTELSDIIGNNIAMGFMDIASPVPHIRNGKLLAVGVTGTRRAPATPQVPTFTEQGFKFDVDGWYGVFLPAGTSHPEMVERLNQALAQVAQSADIRKKFEDQNMALPAVKPAAEFARSIQSDMKIWGGLAKLADLKMS